MSALMCIRPTSRSASLIAAKTGRSGQPVQKAGGRVGTLSGKVYDQSGHIVAGNPKVFEALVEALAPHVPNELQD